MQSAGNAISYTEAVAITGGEFLVLGCDAFGRWSSDAALLIEELSWLIARRSPPVLQKSTQMAFANHWWGLIGVNTQRAVADLMLCQKGGGMISGTDISGRLPALHEVLGMLPETSA